MDKPAGPTSHDVVARARRGLGTGAIGHTGTLDPFATGLLILLVGRATRLARYVEAEAKTYLATARLGRRTTTDDATGDPLPGPASAVPPRMAEVEAALRALVGTQRQRPPAFSAKRVGGERSYARARRGEAVQPAEVEIEVHRVDLVGYRFPDVTFRTRVSAGTYVRALARDLGERLGQGAHLTALRREAVGSLRVSDAVPLSRIGPEALRPVLAVLGQLPRVEVTPEEARALGYGQAVRPGPAGGEGGPVALTEAGRLVAIASWRDGALRPDVVLEAAG